MAPTTIVVFPWRSTDEDGTEHTGWAAQLASHDCGSQGDTDLAALQNIVNWFRLLQTTDRLAGTLAATTPGNDRAARAKAAASAMRWLLPDMELPEGLEIWRSEEVIAL